MSAEKRYKRFEAAKKHREQFDNTYKDAMKYAAQHRETFDYHIEGEKKYDRIFDSTAQTAVLKFASNIQSGMVPPFKKWAKLVPGSDIPAEKQEQAAKQLEAVTDVFFRYLHSSNFDTQISESFVDLAFGTGALLLNEGDDSHPFNFSAVPLAEVYPEKGPFGTLKTNFRSWKILHRNIQQTWPKASMPSEYDADKDADTECEILESTIYIPETGMYEYSVDYVKGKEELFFESMDSSAWIIFRWSAMPGETMGRGPLLTALADIKTLNKTVEFLLKSAALKTIPTFLAADDGVINPHNIVIEPGAIIPCAPFGAGGPPLVNLQVGGDVNLAQFIIKSMQQRIEDIMFTNPLGDVNLPVKTATEQSLRAQDLSNRIGSAFGRLHYECASAIVDRGIYILNKKGLLPVDLEDVKVDGKVIKISYQSPLSQAQDEEDLINTQRYATTMISTYGPQLGLLFINPEGYQEILGKNLNVNSKILPSKEQRDAIVQMVAKLSQAGQPQGPSAAAQVGATAPVASGP